MDKENIENIDSTNDEDEEVAEEGEVAEITPEKAKAIVEQNKRLFARAKKAEGFTLTDGKWVKKEPKPTAVKPTKKIDETPDFDSIIDQKFQERDLNDMNVDDSIKKEIQTFAKGNGMSLKDAMKSNYAQYLIEKSEKESRVANASLGGRSKGGTVKDITKANPQDFDVSTKEGQEQWEEYKRILDSKE